MAERMIIPRKSTIIQKNLRDKLTSIMIVTVISSASEHRLSLASQLKLSKWIFPDSMPVGNYHSSMRT
jgi:hypothetical protein